MLRYGEIDFNSSLRAIIRRANASHRLARDLRQVADLRSLPSADQEALPVVDMWFVDKCMLPTLVGHIRQPDGGCDDHAKPRRMEFTAPLHLLSVQERLARSASRWYRLGSPSPVAEESVARWNTAGGR